MPLWPIFRRKSLPCRWLETEVQRRPLHCDKHLPQEKGGARGVTNASRATALPEMNPSSVLFCSRHRVQRATISEVTLRPIEGGALFHRLSRLALKPVAEAGNGTLAGGGFLTLGYFSSMKNVLPTGRNGLFWGHVRIKPRPDTQLTEAPPPPLLSVCSCIPWESSRM